MTHFIRIIVPFFLIASSAHAELAWVKSEFWQAPYEKNVTVKIKPDRNDLDKVCAEYEKTVKSTPNSTLVSIRRAAAEGIPIYSFSVVFRVDPAATAAFNADSFAKANLALASPEKPDSLPYYSQPVAEVQPMLRPRSEVQIIAKNGSLMALSKSLGLEPLGVKLSGEDKYTEIKVYGRDTVCDIWRGQAHFEFDSDAKISISQEGRKQLDDFYLRIEQITDSVFEAKTSIKARALVLGYRVSEELLDLRLDRKSTEVMIENLANFLFDDEMQRNSRWKIFNKEFHLTVNGSMQGPVNIVMEK